MNSVLDTIERAKTQFRQRLEYVEQQDGLSLAQYVRYLSMQFHLTQDVQRHFFTIAGHSSLAGKGKLRDFLVNFGIEEEMHYRIAKRDLENLGESLLPAPLDVKLWWAYFDRVIQTCPFIRLGATCILENLGSGSSDVVKRLLQNAPFINERTARFLKIHLHEELPHGDQIIQVLQAADLSQAELADLAEGAVVGATLYLRMVDWALQLSPVQISPVWGMKEDAGFDHFSCQPELETPISAQRQLRTWNEKSGFHPGSSGWI